MTVQTIKHPLEATPVYPDIPLAAGLTHVAVPVEFVRVECGCRVGAGVRLDDADKAFLSWPCDAHRGRFQAVFDGLVEDGKKPESEMTPTDELLDMLIGSLDQVPS